MTKEELIAEAKRRYPIGTKYISATDPDTKVKILVKDSYTYRNPFEDSIWAHGGGGTLHQDGLWAEIVSTPVSETINNYELY